MDPETSTPSNAQGQPPSQPFAVEPPPPSSPPPPQTIESGPGQPISAAPPEHPGLTKSTKGILVVVLLLLFAIIVSGVYLFSLSSRQTGQSAAPVETTPAEPEVELLPSMEPEPPVTDVDSQINEIDTSINEADFEEIERELESL